MRHGQNVRILDSLGLTTQVDGHRDGGRFSLRLPPRSSSQPGRQRLHPDASSVDLHEPWMCWGNI